MNHHEAENWIRGWPKLGPFKSINRNVRERFFQHLGTPVAFATIAVTPLLHIDCVSGVGSGLQIVSAKDLTLGGMPSSAVLRVSKPFEANAAASSACAWSSSFSEVSVLFMAFENIGITFSTAFAAASLKISTAFDRAPVTALWMVDSSSSVWTCKTECCESC